MMHCQRVWPTWGDMVEYDDTKWDIMISGTKNDPKVTVKAKK